MFYLWYIAFERHSWNVILYTLDRCRTSGCEVAK